MEIQGEVLELDFEHRLRRMFHRDSFVGDVPEAMARSEDSDDTDDE
jgi:hypothetical protein